jgi:hypothetical protein
MGATEEKMAKNSGTEATTKIDPAAPAGSANSLGAQSVRDGRPSTDDSTEEAMDEAGPGVVNPVATGKTGKG